MQMNAKIQIKRQKNLVKEDRDEKINDENH